jgi:23S rRNA (uracil1939-C5)-methyltransferase
VQCKHFGVCGGCTLPGVPYAEQLARKRTELSRLLRIDVPPLLPSPLQSGFRSKVAFVFDSDGRALVMGHYALGSQRVVPIDECPVHHERGNRIAFALRDRLVRANLPAGVPRHIVVRTTQDGREASAMLVVRRNDKSLRTPVKGLLASPDRPDGFFVNIHDRPGPFMIGEETIKIAGRSHVKETVREVSYLVSPTAFFQTNVGAAALLVDVVVEAAAGRQILDLYCGSGLFALPLAGAGARVTAVEENRQAIADGNANLRLNRMDSDRVRFISARVEEAIARLAAERWDTVVLDPPRQGCPPSVITAVFERMKPARAVYVSCDPDALARELPVILKAGYRAARVQAVDMFPHTNHIETVVVLDRG